MFLSNYIELFRGTTPQLVCVLFGTLNALSDGMHFGWSAPTVPMMESGHGHIKIQEKDGNLLELLYMVFGLVGLPVTVYLADKIGRQKSVLIASATSFIGWTLICAGNSVTFLYIARSLVGAAADVAFVCSPMYVAEIAHKKIRGFLAGTIYVMELGGSLLMYSIAPYVSTRIPPIVGICIVTTQLIVFPFMPESPYYHIYKGKEEAARKSLRKLRGSEDIEEELKEIIQTIERQKQEKGRVQDLFMVKSNRKAIIILMILNGAQHMIGYTAILMNLHTILAVIDADFISVNIVAIIYMSIMLVSSILAILTVDKFGRKILMIVSSVCSGLCLLIIGLFCHLKSLNVDIGNTTWVPIVFIMLYAAFFKLGVGIVPIVLTAELFPAKMKAIGMTAADGFYVLFASVSLSAYSYLFLNYGLHFVFYMFAIFALLTFIFSVIFVPETKGKTLEEIQMMLKK